MLRYRTGIDRKTGKPLTGLSHLLQSIADILTTLVEERIMLLDYGVSFVRQLGRNMHTGLLIRLFSEAVEAIHRYEPEFRVKQLKLVTLDRTGSFGFTMAGDYFPEGRLGNYDVALPLDFFIPLDEAAT